LTCQHECEWSATFCARYSTVPSSSLHKRSNLNLFPQKKQLQLGSAGIAAVDSACWHVIRSSSRRAHKRNSSKKLADRRPQPDFLTRPTTNSSARISDQTSAPQQNILAPEKRKKEEASNPQPSASLASPHRLHRRFTMPESTLTPEGKATTSNPH